MSQKLYLHGDFFFSFLTLLKFRPVAPPDSRYRVVRQQPCGIAFRSVHVLRLWKICPPNPFCSRLAHNSYPYGGSRKTTFHPLTPNSPSPAKLFVLSLFLSECENHKAKCMAFQTNSSLTFCPRKWSPSCPGKWQNHPGLMMSCGVWHVLLSESAVSSWKSSRPPLGQVRVPAAFLEHSKPQTPIPLTHITSLEDCSTDTRKTAPNNPGVSLRSRSGVTL